MSQGTYSIPVLVVVAPPSPGGPPDQAPGPDAHAPAPAQKDNPDPAPSAPPRGASADDAASAARGQLIVAGLGTSSGGSSAITAIAVPVGTGAVLTASADPPGSASPPTVLSPAPVPTSPFEPPRGRGPDLRPNAGGTSDHQDRLLLPGWLSVSVPLVNWSAGNPTISPAAQVLGNGSGPSSPTTTGPIASAPASQTTGDGGPLDLPWTDWATDMVLSQPSLNQALLDPSDSTLAPGDAANAVVLPGQARVTIGGTLDSDHPYKVFEIPSDPRTHEVAIRLSSPTDDQPLNEGMALYDAVGRKIADLVPGADPHVLSMNVSIDHVDWSPGLYLKIVALPNASRFASASTTTTAPGPEPSSFVLQVTREPDAPLGSSEPTAAQLPSDASSASSEPVTPAPNVSDRASEPAAPTRPVDPEALALLPATIAAVASGGSASSSLSGASPVATGPLPERGAAALGGVLAEGEPVPQLDRHEAARVDLALLGLPEPLPMPGAGDADLEALLVDLDVAPEDAEPLAARHGPGRFPLLASASDSGSQEAPAPDFDALVAVLPAAAAPAESESESGPAEPLKTAMDDDAAPGSRRLHPASVVSGLTVALSMVFGLVLPELRGWLATKRPRDAWLRFRRELRRRLRGRSPGGVSM